MERHNVPPQYRRPRRRNNNLCGCTCDCNYARSIQGICKIVAVIILGLAWIVIGASPYYRPIFVIGGETWPFHIVMLISIVVWLATLVMYCLFMSGYHLSMGHYNWPFVELIFNICASVLILIAACLEAGNLWRWDMSHGNVYNAGGGNSAYSGLSQYGLRPGMSFTQTLNFGSYCGNRPQDCRDYFSLLAGHNTYYTNHIFGAVFLFFSIIAYLVSTFFAYKTYRIFERDMYKPGQMPKPTLWMRFTYGIEQATGYVKDKANKALGRNDEDGEADVEDFVPEKIPARVDDGGFEEARSSRGEGASSRSSHHGSRSHRSHGSRSRSSHHPDSDGRSSRHHRHDDRSSRSSRHHRSETRSPHGSTDRRSRSSSKPKSPDYHTGHEEKNIQSVSDPLYDVPPPYEEKTTPPLSQPQPAGVFPHLESKKKGSKKGKKEPAVDMSPVASVMI